MVIGFGLYTGGRADLSTLWRLCSFSKKGAMYKHVRKGSQLDDLILDPAVVPPHRCDRKGLNQAKCG